MINEKRIEEKLKTGKRLSKLDAPKELNDNDFIVSKTYTKWYITYCNRIFVEAAGWSRFELIGANHNIIRHPHMPKIAFKILWDLIQSKKEFFGFVKNLRKNGGFYWVFAYITLDLDLNGNIVGYASFRKKTNLEGIRKIESIYKELLEAEKVGRINETLDQIEDLLKEAENTFNTIIEGEEYRYILPSGLHGEYRNVAEGFKKQ